MVMRTSSFGALQKIGDVSRAHIVGGFAVDRDNDVAWMNAGAIRGVPTKGAIMTLLLRGPTVMPTP